MNSDFNDIPGINNSEVMRFIFIFYLILFMLLLLLE